MRQEDIRFSESPPINSLKQVSTDHFGDSVVKAIGILTSFKPNHTVKMKEIVPEVMKDLGIDSKKHLTVQKKVQASVRWHADTASSGYLKVVRKGQWTLTDRGQVYARTLLVEQPSFKDWLQEHPRLEKSLVRYAGSQLKHLPKNLLEEEAQKSLTAWVAQNIFCWEEGFRNYLHARFVEELSEKYGSGKNVTTTWIQSKLTAGLLDRMTTHLYKLCFKSRDLDEVQDLAHSYLLRLMETDGLKKMLGEGRYPSVSNLCTWATRHAYSKFRDAGQDAHGRSFRGAFTPTELGSSTTPQEKDLRHQKLAKMSLPTLCKPLSPSPDSTKGETPSLFAGSRPFTDLASREDTEFKVIQKIDNADFEVYLDNLLLDIDPIYAGILKKYRSGMTLMDIAPEYGISRSLAGLKMKKIRKLLHEDFKVYPEFSEVLRDMTAVQVIL